MSSALPIAKPDIGRLPASDLGRRVVHDLASVALIVILSMAVGLAINRISSGSLPILYRTPEQRFDAQLASLIAVPPFQIAPAATLGLAEFRSAVASRGALILDARPSSFFQRGHVPGA
jgi:hypothetical protein